MDLRLTPSSSLSFLFSRRMEKDHEEVSTSKAGCRRGTPREMPTASNLIVAMPVEELRLYIQIPIEIGLETSNGATTTTVGEANNVVYFTQEHFVAELRLPHSIVDEVVPSFHSGTSYTHTSERFSDFDGLQYTELSLPAGCLASGDLFHFYFEAGDWGPFFHVVP